MASNLLKRGARYYVRIRIPKDLGFAYGGKHHISYALATSNFAEARRLARLESAKIQAQFDDYRHNSIRINILPVRAVSSLGEWELEQIAATVSLHHLQADEFERTQLSTPEQREAYALERLEYGGELKRIRRAGDFTAHYRAAASVLRLLQITFEETDPAFQRFNLLLLDASIKAADVVARRIQGERVDTADVVPLDTSYRPASKKSARTASDITETALSRNANLASKTRNEKRALARDFDAWTQNKHIGTVSRRDCQQFADFLSKSGLMPNTVKKKMGFLQSVFEEAIDEELLKDNPVKRVRLPAPSRKKGRLPYEIVDLQAILNGPVYANRQRPVGGRGEAAAWIPLIGMFSGARLEEIAQLNTDDIFENSLDGALVFRFMDLGEGQKVKTTASRRLVPVHDELVAAGLLEFLESQRKACRPRLFHELTPDPSGALSGAWSKWWGRYARNVLKIGDPRKVFHSFRHSFVHVLRESGIEEDVRRALVGHALLGVHAKYGSEAFPMRPKVNAMKVLRYPGLIVPKIT